MGLGCRSVAPVTDLASLSLFIREIAGIPFSVRFPGFCLLFLVAGVSLSPFHGEVCLANVQQLSLSCCASAFWSCCSVVLSYCGGIAGPFNFNFFFLASGLLVRVGGVICLGFAFSS